MSGGRTWLCAASALVGVAAWSGCIQSRALERQCNQLRLGMPFADAYRTVTAASPRCAYHRPGKVDEEVHECMKHRSDAPAYVSWEHQVQFVEAPDQCRMELDEAGRVVDISYARGGDKEARMHKGNKSEK